jgi:hypothetical protein
MPLIKHNPYRVVFGVQKPLKHQCLQGFARIAKMKKKALSLARKTQP